MSLSIDRLRIAETLNRLPFVTWDRLVDATVGDPADGNSQIKVYGWIGRPDGRSDFVVVDFVSWDPAPGFLTSSSALSGEIGWILNGEDSDHFPCQRVEDVLDELVDRAVRLDPTMRGGA